MALRFVIIAALLIGFGTIALTFFRLIYRYGSIANIFKAEKLKYDTYWLEKGKSPFGDTLAVRVIDIKSDYVKFEVTPGSFDSLSMKDFLSQYTYVKDEGYKFPNLHDIWEEKSENPFNEKGEVTVTALKKGWVSYTDITGKEHAEKMELFMEKYAFKDFQSGYSLSTEKKYTSVADTSGETSEQNAQQLEE